MIFLVLTLGLSLAAASQDSIPGAKAGPEMSVIEVTIAPVRVEDGGNLVVALFAGEETWLDLGKAFALQTVPADSDTIEVSFQDVPLGEYALEVLHDKNENGKLDMRRFPFPKPKEGVGVSNNHRRMGKPKYSEALFTVGTDTTRLNVELVY